ncbi:glycosyltransferase [Streptococcus moroccensis]|uniref:Glycosyltransferase involved in cell wall biosynthesis n=1 Tax=Streptococcus moroccensis TaxID=1451356 RepID=A0ABT9YQA8_9STRE|nr:glycosyltransferase [Streptococcus moroccensis]MDQ0222179.1 glycosyltransferase involved in cell wall biosynthesis [Streptococcus moroccensis]
MKLLFISPTGTLDNGAEKAGLNVMSYLVSLGHQVYNVFPANHSATYPHYLKLMEEEGIGSYPMETLKWWWPEAPGDSPFTLDSIRVYHHQNIADIKDIIKTEGIDLVISNTVNVFQGAVAARSEGIPSFYLLHEFPYGEFEYYSKKLTLLDQLSDKIFAVEGELFKELSKYFSSQKLESFLPFSNVSDTPLKETKERRFISIGALTERKNQLELIKAFSRLEAKPDSLVFIGGWDDDYKEKCDDYIQSHDIKNIHFLGFQEKPWDHVGSSDIIVFSSKLEAFPLVFVESILKGVPAIISDNVGHLSVKEVFNAGTVYPLGSIDTLSDEMNLLLNQFEAKKEQALTDSQKAWELYTIEEASKNIVNQLNVLEDKRNQGVQNLYSELMGLSFSSDVLQHIKNETVSIFFSNDDQFHPVKSAVYPLKKSDSIELEVQENNQIRIDLSENPASFKAVQLVEKDSQTEIEPIFSNALEKDGKLTFTTFDPQIVYDVSQYHHQKLILQYEKLEYSDHVAQLNHYYNQLSQDKHQLKDEIEHQQERNKALESDLRQRIEDMAALQHEYNSVITSRRWTIPTKIINFFRRAK